jgi:DNA-binding LacI/PurR family transcriptional regulator
MGLKHETRLHGSKPARGRPPRQRNEIIAHLRRLIVSGKIPPGQRLPTHTEIERRFNVESPTVCIAIDVLRREGFIFTRRRQGTYVAPHPPHLANLGLVIPVAVEKGRYQFFDAVAREARKFIAPGRRVLVFKQIGEQAEAGDYGRLAACLREDRLAGLIFLNDPFLLRENGLLATARPGLPQVMIKSFADTGGYPSVYVDHNGFLPRAFERLAAMGRRRPAVLLHAHADHVRNQGVVQPVNLPRLAAKYGLRLDIERVQALNSNMGDWIAHFARLLLLKGAAGARPDSVVIVDDNLVPDFTAGMAKAGFSAPGKITIIAHANFPFVTPSALPAIRLGYDVSELVSTCMQRIEDQRDGRAFPALTLIPARFEDDAHRIRNQKDSRHAAPPHADGRLVRKKNRRAQTGARIKVGKSRRQAPGHFASIPDASHPQVTGHANGTACRNPLCLRPPVDAYPPATELFI